MALKINEIFYSIQGESTYAGRPCVFVRLTYCNLRCTYCDTEYAFYRGLERSIDEILEEVSTYRCRLVEVTGGEPGVRIVMDLKTPGSGMVASNRWQNLQHLDSDDEIKFVLCDRADYEWARGVIGEHDLTVHHSVLLSPSYDELDPRLLSEWVLADGLPVRVQLQIHKFIWSPSARGV
jgi:7-carboxy-7-deazaguanine synthase